MTPETARAATPRSSAPPPEDVASAVSASPGGFSAARAAIAPTVAGTAFVALCLALWETLVRIAHINPVILPSPSAIVREFFDSPGLYLDNAWYTLVVTLASFVAATVVGIGLAILIVRSKLLENAVYTTVVGLNSVPKVAIAPLCVLWLGTGMAPKIAIGFLVAVFPVLINAVQGFKSVPQDLLDLARVTRGGKQAVLWRILFPYALPSILSGLKVAVSLALVGAIVGEFVAAQRGLGYVILSSQGMFETTRVFVAVVLLAVMGVVLFGAVSFIERRLVPWHISQRGGGRAR